MIKRKINISVEFDLEEFEGNKIVDKKIVANEVKKGLKEYYGWDNHYGRLTVEVIDK